MGEQVRLLCVDDERNVLRALERVFMDEDYQVFTAPSGEEGLEVLAGNDPIQIVISDYRMPGLNGVDFLSQVCSRWPDTVRIVLSGYADTAAVVAAINEGQIYKFIPKPWNDDELKVTIANAVERFFLHQKNQQLMEQLSDSNEELLKLNENLEHLVMERSAKIILQNKALEQSQLVLELLPLGVIGVVPDGMVVLCNQEGGRLLDIAREELLGENVAEKFPPPVAAFVSRGFANDSLHERVEWSGKRLRLRSRHICQDQQEALIVVLDREENNE